MIKWGSGGILTFRGEDEIRVQGLRFRVLGTLLSDTLNPKTLIPKP